MKSSDIHVDYSHLHAFSFALLQAVGLTEKHAKRTAYAICQTSLRGTDSHGIRLLPHYVDVIGTGRIAANAEFVFEQTGAATGCLDAQHGMAHAAISEAMEHAIHMAKTSGAAFISIKNSNHCGAMASYTLKVCEQNMIGFSFTNATVKLQTFNALKPFFGINPLCITAPMAKEEPFCFDAAPTVFSNNKVKMYAANRQQLPEHVAADAHGIMTLNPELAKMLIPLGGEVAGYKGFGWAMMADILCSLLSGMPNGRDVSTMYESDGGDLSKKRYLGQFVGVLNISHFTDCELFKQRLQETADNIRSQSKHPDAQKDIMIPGDPEKRSARKRLETGIPMPSSLLDALNERAEKLSINKLDANNYKNRKTGVSA